MADRLVKSNDAEEAFYAEALEGLAAVARKHGRQNTLINLIGVMGVATGRMICACYPNERDLARAIVLKNIDHQIETMADGKPTMMTRQ